MNHVYNYKIDIVEFLGYIIVHAINMQLIIYKMNICHKNNDLS
jgi:hypothetical protein